MYGLSQKIPPPVTCGFLTFLHKRLRILNQFLHTYYTILSIIMKAKIIVTLYIKNVTGALYTVNYNENTLSVSVSVNAA